MASGDATFDSADNGRKHVQRLAKLLDMDPVELPEDAVSRAHVVHCDQGNPPWSGLYTKAIEDSVKAWRRWLERGLAPKSSRRLAQPTDDDVIAWCIKLRRHKPESTVEQYTRVLEHIARDAGVRPRDLTENDIEDHIAACDDRNQAVRGHILRKNSVKAKLTPVSEFFKWLNKLPEFRDVDQRDRPTDPTLEVRDELKNSPDDREENNTVPVDPDDLAYLVAQAELDAQAEDARTAEEGVTALGMLLAGSTLGFRAVESSGVDTTQGPPRSEKTYLRYNPTKKRWEQRLDVYKGNRRRAPVWQPASMVWVQFVQRYFPNGGALCPAHWDAKTARDFLEGWALRYGKALASHQLRARYCLDVYKQTNHDLVATMKLMRHRKTTTTQRYITLPDDDPMYGVAFNLGANLTSTLEPVNLPGPAAERDREDLSTLTLENVA
ncbi:hypothetical protein AB0J38_00225 [Streptomyces sp. NPDC050095]|uniref:hypothetical protein n=1 Tax=unclassified Streptomyces TaxID=2593676 RepID=UPI0034414B85